MDDRKFRVRASNIARDANDDSAVLVSHGQIIIRLTIAQARELSMDLARAADEAEAKLESI